ncbi:hypothetical protein ABZX12_24300 [Kribbella sp. NPDC003505]|uniref:hypothetical protein n=1 Tax=Kribbella sp. NPDC003505 TaxID=3154448 RepID=UPI0033A9B791
MSETGDYRDVEQVVVAVDGVEETWSLEFRSRPDSWWTLILTGSGGASWIGAGQGLWTAFLELRRQIDPMSYKLCCAGAQVDANMRHGRWAGSDVVDILDRRTLLGFRHQEFLLAYAPAGTIGTVEEQQARYDRWLATPWWKAFLPGDVTR